MSRKPAKARTPLSTAPFRPLGAKPLAMPQPAVQDKSPRIKPAANSTRDYGKSNDMPDPMDTGY